MKNTGRFERVLTGVALLVLAVGFNALGLLSFINNHPENVVIGLFSEATYSIIGSSISIIVGATFLTAAVRFLDIDLWQQYTKLGGIQDKKSLTGMRILLRKIEYWHQGSINSFEIMCRDSKGFWHRVRWGGKTASSFSLAETDQGQARKKLLE